MITTSRLRLLACCASTLAMAASAAAQTAPRAPAAAEPAAPGGRKVEDIVVTAQSRSQKLQRVPISISAFSGDFLHQTATQNFGDLQRYTPGLSVDNTSLTQPKFTIRGISTDDFGVGTDPAVGIYIDGVYAARSGELLIFFDDLERVEVLKGPQGTLFGRNTAAGAISVITKKPSDKYEGTLDYRVGNYGKQEGTLMLNVPVTDTFSIRVNGVINRRDGYLTNYNGDHLNDEHNNSTRVSARWRPTENDDIIFSWDHDNTHIAPPTALGVGPYTPNGGDPFNGVYSRVVDGHETRTLDSLTLTAKHQFDGFSLTSLSAYKSFHTSNRESETGSALIDRYFDTENRETNHSYYQELRINGVWNNLTYVAGASYFYERAKQASIATGTTDSLNNAFDTQAGVRLFDLVASQTHTNLDGLYYQEFMANLGQNSAWSVFGDATYALTPKLNLTAGLRVTGDDKDFQWDSPPGVILNGPASANQLTQTLLKLFNNGNAFFPTYPVPQGVPFSRQLSSTNASPRFVADYHVTPDAMVYASASFGYKAGGFNSVQVNSTFEPEYVDSYEIGMKSDWLDHRLRVNVTGFYYNYTNQQSITLVQAPGAIVPAYQTQTGDSTGKGADFEIRVLPLEGLQLSFAATYLDANWNKRIENGLDLSGQPTGEPNFKGTFGIDYSYDLGTSGHVRFHFTDSYTSAPRLNAYDRQQDALNALYANLALIPGYEGDRNIADARLTWQSASNHYEVSLYALNLFDARYATGINSITRDTIFTPYVRPDNDPRFYGLEMAYHF